MFATPILCHPGGTYTWNDSIYPLDLRMFLLPPRLREMLEKKRLGTRSGVFTRDDHLRHTVREMAVSQRRAEREVYNDLVESGMKTLSETHKYEEIWSLLSAREQQVTALICLGFRSYEIAIALGVSYETVRSHSKHIYAKFDLGRKELQRALRQWDFDNWWDERHG
jgi:DNA-binding CsgD family transcriptional regulator